MDKIPTELLGGCFRFFYEEIRFSTFPKRNKKNLEKEVDYLKRIQRDVSTQILEQERSQPLTKCKVEVKSWLEAVNGTDTEVNTLLEKLSESRSCTCCCFLRHNYFLGKEVVFLIERVRKLVEEGRSFDDDNLVRPIPPDLIDYWDLPTTMVGRKKTSSKIHGYLRDSQVTTIGIWGMGGIGKTTMLKSIKQWLCRNDHDFHYIIWIEMSQNEDDILKIQKQIAKCFPFPVELQHEEKENEEYFRNTLLQRRKSLVLIDNVWKKLDFERIGIPSAVGTTVVKILFTTRSEVVCHDMRAQKIVRLDSLDETESLQLFQGNISPVVDLNDKIVRQRVDEILKRCGGVPLVIVTVARTVANYTLVEEWDDAVDRLRSSREEIEGMDNVMKCLKFSYDKLEDDKIKSCLLYLSLYPEDIFTLCSVQAKFSPFVHRISPIPSDPVDNVPDLLGKEVERLIVDKLVEERRSFDDDNLVSNDPIDNVPDLSTTMVGRDGKSSKSIKRWKNMEDLKRIRDVVSTKIREQERSQPGTECKVEVKGWLDKVNDTEKEVNTLLDKIAESRSCTFYRSPYVNYLLEKEVVHLIDQVNSLVEEGTKFYDKNLVRPIPPDPIHNVPDLPTTMIGRDGKSSEIHGYLRDSQVTIIGIWGMGGIGKTTMLKSIKHGLPRNDFHYIIWIEMSQNEDDILKIQKQIAKCIFLSHPLENEERENARMLANALRSRKSLLLIDNVWKKLNFERIGIPFAVGTVVKILFTTRSEGVFHDMMAQKIVRLDSLDETESLQLFQGNISPDVDLTEKIVRQRVDEILKRCGGLPLVIVTVARTVANYTRVEEWDDAVESLRSSREEIEGMDDVMKCLKFSYDKLEDDKIKSCLLYLSLYPEGAQIYTHEVIKEWVAEGFLDTPNDNSFTRSNERGVVNLNKLKSICLVEKSVYSDDCVKLHNVIRHMLCWIRKQENQEVVIVYNDEISDCNYDRWDLAKRIFLQERHVKGLPKRGMPLCSNLTSLLVTEDYYHQIDKLPTEDFFHFTPSLRVLDLSGTGLVDIPKSIGELVELRYLNLNGTRIRTLPMELGNLKKLKCLDLGNTSKLVTIVGSAISKLSALQSLDLCNTSYQWKSDDVNMTTEHPLLKLEDLRELKNLEDLGVDVGSNSHLDTILCDEILLKSIARISFVRIDFTTIDLGRLQLIELISQRLPELKDLVVHGCALATDILEIKDDQLPLVTKLQLQDLKISSVTLRYASRPFSRLKFLQIIGCQRLKEVSWTARIPFLKGLHVENCNSVRELVEEEEEIREERRYFPKLYKLEIIGLENLERIHGRRSPLLFPALRFLFIERCRKLKQLSFGDDSAKSLEYIKCEKTQWDSLEWENDRVQAKFLPYVHH